MRAGPEKGATPSLLFEVNGTSPVNPKERLSEEGIWEGGGGAEEVMKMVQNIEREIILLGVGGLCWAGEGDLQENPGGTAKRAKRGE